MSTSRPSFTASSIVVFWTYQDSSLLLYKSQNNPCFPAGVLATINSASLSLVNVGEIAPRTSYGRSKKAHSSIRTAYADHPRKAIGLPDGRDTMREPFENLQLSALGMYVIYPCVNCFTASPKRCTFLMSSDAALPPVEIMSESPFLCASALYAAMNASVQLLPI